MARQRLLRRRVILNARSGLFSTVIIKVRRSKLTPAGCIIAHQRGTHMKSLLVVTAIWLVMSGGATSARSERSAIQAVLDAHADAWTRGDAHEAASVMTEDADWISGGGHIYQGRAAIEEMHRELLAGP